MTWPTSLSYEMTSPRLTGSLLVRKKMGMVAVADASTTSSPSMARITRTFRRARPAVSAGNRSRWFSAHRLGRLKIDDNSSCSGAKTPR